MNIFYDVRFLNNPYWDPELRYKTGLEEEVREFIFNKNESKEFLENLKKTLKLNFDTWDKTEEFVVGIACTGGQHRSVAVVEELYSYFKDGYDISHYHRDVKKAVR